MTGADRTLPSSSIQASLNRYFKYGLFGGISGLVTFFPAVILFSQIAIQISRANDYNTNVDGFMAAIVCWLPAVVTSFLLGMAAGAVALRLSPPHAAESAAGHSHTSLLGVILALLAGLLGPVLFVLPLTVLVLGEWRG